MSYKSIDGLMRHLRNNGIDISGSKQKRQLINSGYYHGYKGYRFFNTSSCRIPFQNYDEINATIKYDSKLKALFYEKIMFIETALKNVALECIIEQARSENIQDMYDKVVCGYNNCPNGSDSHFKKKAQERKLNLENKIQSYLLKAYMTGNPKITHFYNNMSYSSVPLWALFEIFTLGDFGYLLSCLTFDARDAISKRLGMNVVATDTNRELLYKYIYALKDLRNAIAHNSVIFDTRYKKIEPSPAMKLYLKQEYSLPYFNFKTLGDYLFLVCHYLKLLKVPKTEVKSFVRCFERITQEYIDLVNKNVSKLVIHTDFFNRIAILKKSI